MKKLVLLILLCFSFVTGCQKEIIDLQQIENKLSKLMYQNELLFQGSKMELDHLKEKYGFDSTDVEEALIVMPTQSNKASMYMIVKAKEKKENEVKQAVDALFEKYKQQWVMGYYPEEEALVKDALISEYHGYLLYIISHDNDLVLKTIKEK